ncbi:hypothetical protein I4F81_010003 [Pyropia yezoensis]|uniref:Uncharacterized protein n=1 Tax=Pyropia yezoensis TaxID=2788 RepID=A0ACC3CB54_PYRYE|nr:hypothetical protein I4F81_010003 [Neopyropia yezoensis]
MRDVAKAAGAAHAVDAQTTCGGDRPAAAPAAQRQSARHIAHLVAHRKGAHQVVHIDSGGHDHGRPQATVSAASQHLERRHRQLPQRGRSRVGQRVRIGDASHLRRRAPMPRRAARRRGRRRAGWGHEGQAATASVCPPAGAGGGGAAAAG